MPEMYQQLNSVERNYEKNPEKFPKTSKCHDFYQKKSRKIPQKIPNVVISAKNARNVPADR